MHCREATAQSRTFSLAPSPEPQPPRLELNSDTLKWLDESSPHLTKGSAKVTVTACQTKCSIYQPLRQKGSDLNCTLRRIVLANCYLKKKFTFSFYFKLIWLDLYKRYNFRWYFCFFYSQMSQCNYRMNAEEIPTLQLQYFNWERKDGRRHEN